MKVYEPGGVLQSLNEPIKIQAPLGHHWIWLGCSGGGSISFPFVTSNASRSLGG